MDINIYDLKLREIDRQIEDVKKRYPSTTDWSTVVNPAVGQNTSVGSHSSATIRDSDGIITQYPILTLNCGTAWCNDYAKVFNLNQKRRIVVEEMQREQQHLKDQYMLQQAEATEFARQQALKAAEEVRAAANKTEQELQIAKQKLAEANEALAKQRAAESLAKSVDTGNLEAGRILMGINTVSKYKTPLIIGAITITVLALGFVGYKMLAKAKKV